MRQLQNRQLWLGHAGDVRDARAILSADIEAVVDLASNEPPAALPRSLISCRLPLIDGAGNPPWLLRLAVQLVADLLRQRIPTLVGCSAGMSRSPIIVAAALSQIEGHSLEDALAHVVHTAPADVSPALWHDVQTALTSSTR